MLDNSDESAGFTRTGHDFPDFGTAVLMAWSNLPEDAQPEDLTVAHIRKFAAEVENYYFKKPDSFKSVMLAFGSNFLNPSFTKDQQLANIRAHLLAFEAEPNVALAPCTFFGRPAVREVARDAYPLLMGREPINFYPGGVPGIAMSGQAITAAQALIFGALRSQGKLMVIGADDFGLVRDIVNEWVSILRKRITLSQLNSDASLEDIAPPRTALVKTLEMMENKRHKSYRGGATLYHFSNSGQGPSVDIYKLPTGIFNFIQEAQTPDARPGWQEIRRRAWAKPKLSKKDAPLPADYEPPEEKQMQLSNRFFNDLFNLPRESGKFVRIYFLRTLYDLVLRSHDWTPEQVGLNRAKIRGIGYVTTLFMEEVLDLDAQRISDIKQLADRLAQVCQNDSPRFRQLMQVRRNWAEVRKVLRQISRRETDNGRAPVVSLDQFLSIFEMTDDNEYVDWGLAWDLVLIRLMETLYKLDPDFFKKNPTPTAEELDEDGTNQTSEGERVPVAV